ncbi:MAG: peptidoglycan DD-metalloendopeptidase family protein [Gammaproteobacteria bacterium]|nr:peptidoglycan DD-metalloendopeptidase family protein [Gammaproteobacteria bacterium]
MLKKWPARTCCSISLAVLVSACGGSLAPVNEHSVSQRHPQGGYREVLAGDTLYSIAWESGRDYRDLANWNQLAPPYLIKPGQKLRLYPPSNASLERRGVAPSTSPATASLPPPVAPSRSIIVEKLPPSKKVAPEKSATANVPRAQAHNATTLTWLWPAEGALLDRYSASGPNKGIDIGGKKGQPIVATSAGQVVYQGSGLRGYGQLIIIKHNADFLSAYAHCDKIYVKEGNVIKGGQKIAAMGNSGTDRVKLHFEIRYRGAPVDPQTYLPKK